MKRFAHPNAKSSEVLRRICRNKYWEDLRWKTATDYGTLDIVAPVARKETEQILQEERHMVTLRIRGRLWNVWCDPRTYYPEHCLAVSEKNDGEDQAVFRAMLGFVKLFPRYVVFGEGETQSFQGGCYSFPLERAAVQRTIPMAGYGDVTVGAVSWPMTTIRLSGTDLERISGLAETVLRCWKDWAGGAKNTMIAAARRRGECYELDLILCRETLAKRGMIEVEGLGMKILPDGWVEDLKALRQVILAGAPVSGNLSQYDIWVNELRERYTFTNENVDMILKIEVGKSFLRTLEDMSAYERTAEGEAGFERFLSHVNRSIKEEKEVPYAFSDGSTDPVSQGKSNGKENDSQM